MSTTVELQTLAEAISHGHEPETRDETDRIPVLSSAEPDAARVFPALEPVISAPKSDLARFTVVALLVTANFIQFVSNFITFSGGIALSKALNEPAGEGKASWMAASYSYVTSSILSTFTYTISLTQGAFVLVSGRLGTIYGHQRVALIGLFLFALFSLINGFMRSFDAFIAFRALSGIGGGIYMPNAVSVLSLTMPPGKARNLLFGLFAAAPPAGGLAGALLTGLCATWDGLWSWTVLFAAVAVTSFACLGLLWWLMPQERAIDPHGKIDFVGACLGLGSLILYNVVWNQAPSVGWTSPMEISLLIISLSMFAGFLVWESKYAKDPIMPLTIFRAPTFLAIVVVVLFSYMAFGIALWYAVSWQQRLRHMSVLQIGLTCIPFGLGSIGAVALAAYMLPRVAAKWLMAIGVAAIFIGSLLLATMPVDQSYWPQVFPAMVLCGFCPDFVYLAAQVIASNSVSRKHQGVASSLVGTLNLYGVSLGLGLAGTIESEVNKAALHGNSTPTPDQIVGGFRAALYFSAGLAAVGLALDFLFVRLPKSEREGWDEQLEEEQSSGGELRRRRTVDASSG